jgi:hypothetical protein
VEVVEEPLLLVVQQEMEVLVDVVLEEEVVELRFLLLLLELDLEEEEEMDTV